MNASDPLVSVIIPLYNHAPYIRNCLHSVYRQTYPAVELIVIDDGSRDASAAVAERYLRRCPYPQRLLRQENRGTAPTINRGIDLSRGRYISVLNSDDRYHRERLATLVRRLEETGSRLAFSKIHHIDQNGEPIGRRTLHPLYYQQALARSRFFPTRTFEFLRNNWAVSSGNLFFRRDLLEDTGPFTDLAVAQDWDFILRAVLWEEPQFVDRVLYAYRVHPKNSIRTWHALQHDEVDQVLSSYLREVDSASNPLAPGPRQWGPYWEVFVSCYLRHLNVYPRTWELLQEGLEDGAREYSAFETRLVETLEAQAAYSFQQSARLMEHGREKLPGLLSRAVGQGRFLLRRLKDWLRRLGPG